MSRHWILTEIFYPNESGSGKYMTAIAQALSKDHDVRVICSYPDHMSGDSGMIENEEFYGKVFIKRVCRLKINKNNLVMRLIKDFAVTFAICYQILTSVRRGDVVLVGTSPPMLPVFSSVILKGKGAHSVLRVDDMYPHAMVAAGILKESGLVTQFGYFLVKNSYPFFDKIVVMGRDMRELLCQLLEKQYHPKVAVITNWADGDMISPREKGTSQFLSHLGLKKTFVVLIAGNLGRVQDIETIAYAAEELQKKGQSNIHFLFIGSGAKENWLKNYVEKYALKNISVLGPQPASQQQEFLNGCDIALLSLKENMFGIGVPSRLYNYMAAGKPILAVVDPLSEAALTVVENKIGWVVPPNNAKELTQTLQSIYDVKDEIKIMGARARSVADENYSRDKIILRYRTMLNDHV